MFEYDVVYPPEKLFIDRIPGDAADCRNVRIVAERLPQPADLGEQVFDPGVDVFDGERLFDVGVNP